MFSSGRLLWLLGSLSLVSGCVSPYETRQDQPVTRLFGDKLVEGPYVSPSAYEQYILAMLQENAGRPEEAVESLRRALGSDGTSAYLRVRLADALLTIGRLDEAREELDSAQRLDPELAETFLVRARLRARLGDHAGAALALERSIAIDPTLEEAYVALATMQRDEGQEDRSLSTMRALAAHVMSATAEEALGRAALRARDRKGAREHLRRAIELDGARNDARIELARLLLADGDSELGLTQLLTAAERSRQPALSIELARTYSLLGRGQQAQALLDRLEEDAESVVARLDVASAFMEIGMPRRAAFVANAVLADRRSDARASARVIAARAAEAEGSVSEAQSLWQEIAPTDAEYVTAIRARARIAHAQGHDREAVALLQSAVVDRTARGRLDERDQLAIGLADLRAKLGDGEAALAMLDELSAKRPYSIPLKLARARLQRDAGQVQQAVALLRPLDKDVRALHLLGDIIAAQRPEVAIGILERAEGLAPNDASIADSLGVVYLQRGRLDDAERLLTRADRLSPPEVEVLMHLSRLYQQRDDRDRATALLRRALAAHPGDRARQEIEAQLIVLQRGHVGAR